MKKLSSLMLIPVFVLFMAGSAAAQAGKSASTPEERAKKMTDKMKADIQLDESQYSKVYELNLKHAKQMQESRSVSEKERKDRMQAFKQMRDERNKELSSILSEDQMKKLNEQQKANRKNFRDKKKKSHSAS